MNFKYLISELKLIDTEKLDKIILELIAARRVYLIGNGGSASTAQHFEADLQNLGIDAICLDNNIARITALTNDAGWDNIYVEQLKHMSSVDCLVIFTVHGSSGSDRAGPWSQNLAKAAKFAALKLARVVLFSGCYGGELAPLTDLALTSPSGDVDIIEPIHSVLCHEISSRIKNLRNSAEETQ